MRHFVKLVVIQAGKVLVRDIEGIKSLPFTPANVVMGRDFRDNIRDAIHKSVRCTITNQELSHKGVQVQYHLGNLLDVYRVDIKLGHGRVPADCQYCEISRAIEILNPSDSYILKAYESGCNRSYMVDEDTGFIEKLV